MHYNWQHKNWPHFTYDLTPVQDLLYAYAQESHALKGRFTQIGETPRETMIQLMVSEAFSTSDIEGETFDLEDLQSSIEKELGVRTKISVKDRGATGISKVMVSARQTYSEPLTEELLFYWHDLIITDSFKRKHMEIGAWRTSPDPMYIVSGVIGKEKVHFEAPPAHRVKEEMSAFIQWFNQTSPRNLSVPMPGPVRAALAHLYFESIHPFADGNGRIGRAISEKALSEDLGHPALLSLSSAIHKNKKLYYASLAQASRCEIDVTSWITYFVKTVYEAQLDSKELMTFVLNKAKFWNTHKDNLNPRQEKVLARLFQAGPSGFSHGISAQKYIRIAKCSKATATRDLLDLVEQGCLRKLPEGGRSTRYELVMSHNIQQG